MGIGYFLTPSLITESPDRAALIAPLHELEAALPASRGPARLLHRQSSAAQYLAGAAA